MIKEQNKGIATILALALIPLSGFAIDIYLPSMPNMGTALNCSSMQVQLTISVFLISYGIAQLFVGSILDSFGRYKPALAGLLLFAISCIVIAQTRNIYLIYLMRAVHGITVAVIVVAKRAYFVDLFSGEKLKHYLSIFTIIWSTGPILAPFLGGYLQNSFGWQSNFYFLAVFAVIIAILEFIFSGETLQHVTEFKVKRILNIYSEMFKTASFSLGIVMLGFSYSMVMVYNMTGPYIIQHHLNLTPIISGYGSLILGFAWMAGGFIGKATINRPFFGKLAMNIGFQALFVIAMIASLSFISNLYSLIFFAFLVHVTAGYTYNNYFAYCMARFPKNAGIAGGLTGGIVYIIVSMLSYTLIYFIPAKDERNLSYSYLVLVILSILIMLVVAKVNKKTTI